MSVINIKRLIFIILTVNFFHLYLLTPPAFSQTSDDKIVTEIKFEGLFRVDDLSVRKKISQELMKPLDIRKISEDIKKVYGMGVFEDVQVYSREGAGGLILIYRLKERPAIQFVKLQGNDEISEEDIMKVVSVKPATIIDFIKLDASVEKIKDLYIEKGYYLAEVSYKLKELPDNTVDVIFVIKEHAKITVRKIEFIGNKSIPDSEIKDIMITKEGGMFSWLTGSGSFKKILFEQDMDRAQYFYLTKGFINIHLGEPVITLSKDRESILISIPVLEGKKFTVGKIDIRGEDFQIEPQDLKKLTEQLKLKKSDIFNYMNVQTDAIMMGDYYKDMGYAFTNISNLPKPDEETQIVDFTYLIQRGNKADFGKIYITGNDATRDWVIRREMLVFEGDLFNETKLKESQSRIRRLGFFDSVDISSKPGAKPNTVDVFVKVKERQTGAFTVGAGFSSIETWMFQATIQKQNFMGRGQNLAFQALFSSLRTIFTLSFDEPHFFDTDWMFGFELYNYEILYYDFIKGTSGGDVTFGYRLTEDIYLSLTYKLEDIAVSIGGQRGQTVSPLKNLFRSGLTSSLMGTLSYDTRDDRLFPTTGNYSSLSLEVADDSLGSDFKFMRLLATSRQFFPFVLGSVFKFRETLGYITGFDTYGVPIHERFILGGIFSIRGFNRLSIGPKMDVGSVADPASSLNPFVIGGNKEVIFNAELEFPIFKEINLRGVFFFDAGNAYNEDQNIDILDLRTSMGFGFRWWSPIGPFRFEWGFPLAPRKDEPPMVFEFNIGTF
jgi:outer membrane protein insertion porin family